MKQSPQKLVSIIVPVFNEEDTLAEFTKRLNLVLKEIENIRFEIIFINDGSTDGTSAVLKKLKSSTSFKIVTFQKNQGQQKAILAGFLSARGQALIVLDADLQDPPEYIPQLIANWEMGNDVVMTFRIKRKDGFFKKLTAAVYYRILNLIDPSLPVDCGDFYLADQRVIKRTIGLKIKSPYLRGLLPGLAQNIAYISIERDARWAGKSGYSFFKMCKLAGSGLIYSLGKNEK